jgi:hypothetical protein
LRPAGERRSREACPHLSRSLSAQEIAGPPPIGAPARHYQVPFTFNAKIVKLNIVVDSPKLSTADIKLLKTEAQRDNHSSE